MHGRRARLRGGRQGGLLGELELVVQLGHLGRQRLALRCERRGRTLHLIAQRLDAARVQRLRVSRAPLPLGPLGLERVVGLGQLALHRLLRLAPMLAYAHTCTPPCVGSAERSSVRAQ